MGPFSRRGRSAHTDGCGGSNRAFDLDSVRYASRLSASPRLAGLDAALAPPPGARPGTMKAGTGRMPGCGRIRNPREVLHCPGGSAPGSEPAPSVRVRFSSCSISPRGCPLGEIAPGVDDSAIAKSVVGRSCPHRPVSVEGSDTQSQKGRRFAGSEELGQGCPVGSSKLVAHRHHVLALRCQVGPRARRRTGGRRHFTRTSSLIGRTQNWQYIAIAGLGGIGGLVSRIATR